ncbi:MAG: hypothetical protein A2V81_00280 [Candidatus Abawacabacteria bacterium RBG_16_42_10]|uniref:tRNA-dihydrouridine synthase n=1 Tax=Candidatus Abawacabacteria bacterium RBG_16_42_10 TaxID=1817814 RepID=A0A1F4XLA3_9BACT|nr:MAG: hypothetical protein A2V81_00280 [Candidatus Abawacabacteria bacterium RBG_16_42_10]
MFKGFWEELPRPIIGLSPMDGVTDAAFRFIVSKYGKPLLHITEFVSVEGMNVGNPAKVFEPFKYSEVERPVIAQLFGTDTEAFYNAAIMVGEMGFDGIDINMGCPAKNISARGAGAGLIQNPKLAKEIIRSVKRGAKDFAEGKSSRDLDLPQTTKKFMAQKWQQSAQKRRLLPVSVKTRIGFDDIVIEDWVRYLLEEEPVNISVHGRTLKQMYTGEANWEAIGKAAEIVKKTETSILGNGDIKSVADAHTKLQQYHLDGVLIGRASFGNPWIFQGHYPTLPERLKTALEHAYKYEELYGTTFFHPMRKHLAWYMHDFPGAKELRVELIKTNSASEVEKILSLITK